jgi:hypothetical protein
MMGGSGRGSGGAIRRGGGSISASRADWAFLKAAKRSRMRLRGSTNSTVCVTVDSVFSLKSPEAIERDEFIVQFYSDDTIALAVGGLPDFGYGGLLIVGPQRGVPYDDATVFDGHVIGDLAVCKAAELADHATADDPVALPKRLTDCLASTKQSSGRSGNKSSPSVTLISHSGRDRGAMRLAHSSKMITICNWVRPSAAVDRMIHVIHFR